MFSRTTVLLVAALCSALAGSAHAQGRRTSESLLLTGDRPSGSFFVSRATLDADPTTVTIELTNVVNPKQTPLGFFVYLVDPEHSDRRKLLGNFALYPADRPGKFLLKAAEAVRWYRSQRTGADARLAIEIKRLDESKPWTGVEVRVAPPKWTKGP
ncbi:MAG TPA: hypothetical protein VKW78_17930 [Terriglobales bacterium]|nr:hypothetical protein [Terriglobales bacterium]